MAEESKVRFVRCPKCESLIKELPDYSVYKCGSCAAVLQAKKKEPASNGFLDKPIEKGRGDCEKADNQLDKGGSVRSAYETENCRAEGISRRKDRIFGEKSMNFNSHSSRTDKEVFLDDDKNVRENRHGHDRTEKGVGYFDNYVPSSKNPQRHYYQDMNTNRSKSVNSSRESKVGDYSPKLADFARSLRLKGVDRDGFGRFYKRSLGTIDEQDRFSAVHYPDEGPSNYRCGSVYGYHKPVKSFEYLDVPNGFQNFEKDRAQLLKKLDELKDQLSRSHDMPQTPREMVPSDKMASINHLGGSIGNKSSAHRRSAQYHHVSKLTYLNHSSMNDDDRVQNFYGNFHPLSKNVHRKISYEDSLSPGMHRRHHNQISYHHPQQRTYGYGYSSRQYLDFNEDLASYPNPDETLYHFPACSCLHCYDKNWKGPSQVPPAGFSNRRFLRDPCSSTFNHYVNSDRVGQHYRTRAAKGPHLNFQDPAVHIWPSDIDSDIEGFGRRSPRKAVLTSRNKRLCHPIASGAPFITCYNCLELLKLPRKFRKMKNDWRLRCGACSTVIVFEMEKKRLIISVPGSPMRRPPEAEEKSSELLNDSHPGSHGFFNAGGAVPTSSNVENFGYDQISSKEEEGPDNVIDRRDSPGSSELPFSCDFCPTVSSLPFQEQVNNPSSNQTVSRRTNANRAKLARVIPVKNASQVVSEKNALVATEVEVSLDGYLNTSSYQNSSEASKEDNQLKLHKGSKSFLVGLIKKSFRDFSRSNDNIKNERPNVLVNGQPISDSVVRKAEKQAGPILPGNYCRSLKNSITPCQKTVLLETQPSL
ncbi:uncharacterized protein LOC111291201 isoform X2 [Durio zibethinus]|uniref:Uncharacterized protein LOC111291201 isoform X2 n=1 Tax=Durio zibethinus TaxID=66656 RepID=A0A6P5YDX3_DURZI|nr:uncharacterized protein LOC111291201 isoform X2 [Durio zibethinus]